MLHQFMSKSKEHGGTDAFGPGSFQRLATY